MGACRTADEFNRSLINCKVRFREQKDHIRQLHREGLEHKCLSELLSSM